MPPRAEKRPRRDFSLHEKVWLLDFKEKNPKATIPDCGYALAKHLTSQQGEDQRPVSAPARQTVNGWLKQEEKLRQQAANLKGSNADAKRMRKVLVPELEEALVLWFHQQQARKLVINDDVLREQARVFSKSFDVPEDFTFSNGWLCNVKKRHGIRMVYKHGEANDADQEGVKLCREAIPRIVAEGGYTADRVYNQDETGQCFRQLPSRTLATGNLAGGKKDKTRFTASLCCNASGTDKRDLFIIGKAKKPHSFPSNFNPQRDWQLRYSNNAKAWMLRAEFSAWVKEWNTALVPYASFPNFYLKCLHRLIVASQQA